MNHERAVCTIIAKNYVAFARTLARSFLAEHPDHKCYVLIVDDFAGYINADDESFEIIKLSELEIPNLPQFCFKYDVKELCTAVKAHLLDYLIRQKSIQKLLYLDPDILVTASLDEIYEKLDTNDIVLTPHLDTDYPDDGLLPDDSHILRAGQFNLGFIGVNSSENAKSFLIWWKEKLYDHCIVDVLNGYFVDQKFIDFVPVLFENFHIEKQPGYNVAYWNLHSRRVHKENGDWQCNDGPLYFFHFSGCDPESEAISSHIPVSLARHRLSRKQPDLKYLFAEYKEMLIENGQQEASAWPYTFGYFATGESIPYELRKYYRSVPEKWRSLGDPFRSDTLKQKALKFGLNGHANNQGRTAMTPAEQLSAILNSRAWRWVSRYGRLKDRYLTPVAETVRRVFGVGRSATDSSRKK
jgi:hypothetical protein